MAAITFCIAPAQREILRFLANYISEKFILTREFHQTGWQNPKIFPLRGAARLELKAPDYVGLRNLRFLTHPPYPLIIQWAIA